MKKTVTLTVSLIASVQFSFAGNWTGGGNDLDIANPSNWGEQALEGKDMQWEGTAAYSSPLGCSSDFTFNRIKVVRADLIVFDLEQHTITSTGIPAIRTEGNGVDLTLRNGQFIASNDGTSLPSLRMFFSDNTITFSGNNTTGSFKRISIGCENNTIAGNRDRLIIRDGAALEVRGGDAIIGSSNGGVGNMLIVDGGTFTTTGIFKLGVSSAGSSNAIHVLNGGRFEVNRINNGGDTAAVQNRIVVSNGTFLAHGYCRLGGWKEGSQGNEIVIAGNSSVSTDGGEMSILFDTSVTFVFPAVDQCSNYKAFSCSQVFTISDQVVLSFDGKSMKVIAKAGGATLTLFAGNGGMTITDANATLARWSAAANAAYEGASVTKFGNSVILDIPEMKARGFVMSLR